MGKLTRVQAVKAVADAMESGDWAAALVAIEAGEQGYPNAKLPAGATWGRLRAIANVKLNEAAPVSEPVDQQQEPEPAVEETAAEPVAQDQADAPAAESAPAATLHIVHTVDNGTILTGTSKEDGTKEIIGSSGQSWSWHRTERYWFLGRSAGFAGDAERIGYAAQALRASGFIVSVEIDNRNYESGVIAGDKPDSDYRQDRLLKCRSHARRLEYAAAGSVAPVSAPPAPVAEVAPVSAPPAPVAEAAPVRALSMLDMDTLIALVKAGEPDAVEEIKARMCLPAVSVTPVRQRAARAVAPVSAPPAPVAVVAGPLTFVAKIGEGARAKATSSDVRRRLHEEITRKYGQYGAEVRVFLDKGARTLDVTVSLADAPQQVRDRITAKMRNVTLAQRGVVGEVVAAAEPVNA